MRVFPLPGADILGCLMQVLEGGLSPVTVFLEVFIFSGFFKFVAVFRNVFPSNQYFIHASLQVYLRG